MAVPTTDRTKALTTWVVVLGIVAVGLAGWVVYDLFFGPTTAPNTEMSQLLDDYTAAWNDHDGEAFMALVTEDFVFESDGGISTRTYQAQSITASSEYGWEVDQVGEPMWAGDGPWYVTTVDEVSWEDAPAPIEGISTFEVVEMEDGSYLIAQHVFFGDQP